MKEKKRKEKERKGKERKGKERKGKERKGKKKNNTWNNGLIIKEHYPCNGNQKFNEIHMQCKQKERKTQN